MGAVQFGFVVPWADAAQVGELAASAELNGWDGLFVWEPVWGVDAWVSLGVAATRTTRIRLGTMLTPVSRRKPWELAGQIATVDRLSGGRVTLGVGLGAPDTGFEAFGEVTDRRVRAELVDEGLAIMQGLWAGQPYRFDGRHYRVGPTDFPTLGAPTQRPRPPIWCVGALGRARSMRRAVALDGLIPQVVGDGGTRQCTLDELAAAMHHVRDDVGDRPYDVVVEGTRAEHCPAAWAAAGATWWLETMWDAMGDPDPVSAALDRLAMRPPAEHLD